MHECLKILLNDTIQDFGLPIYLWVVGGTHLKFTATHPEQLLSEVANK